MSTPTWGDLNISWEDIAGTWENPLNEEVSVVIPKQYIRTLPVQNWYYTKVG